MMQPRGYIKLFRSLIHNTYYRQSEYIHLWVHLLMHAAIEKQYVHNICLKPGQLITGRKRLSHDTGISESKIQRILSKFESDEQIMQHTTNKYRVITIINWTLFQQDLYSTAQQNTQHNEQQETPLSSCNSDSLLLQNLYNEQHTTQQPAHIIRSNKKTTTTSVQHVNDSSGNSTQHILSAIESKFQKKMPTHSCLPFIEKWLKQNMSVDVILTAIDNWIQRNPDRYQQCNTLAWIDSDMHKNRKKKTYLKRQTSFSSSDSQNIQSNAKLAFKNLCLTKHVYKRMLDPKKQHAMDCYMYEHPTEAKAIIDTIQAVVRANDSLSTKELSAAVELVLKNC